MKLGKKEIGLGKKPYFIAEMSGNHNQSLEKAFEIVDAAAAAGADALKIQTYTPDTMTIDLKEDEFFIEDKNSLWKGNSLYDLYKIAMTPWEWHKPIMERCLDRGLEFFSTPFDATAVDFLEELNVPFYKIASFENNDLPLIKRVAQTKKPLIMSTGMATITEIHEAVEVARSNGCEDIVLLKCTSCYPARAEDANLATINNLRETFKVEVGLSDHTMGWTVPIVAAIQGATVIEKHFTLRRSEGGVDSAFSMEPEEFKTMIKEVNDAIATVGSVHYGLQESEVKSRRFRRSIYIVKDVRKGEKLTKENTRIIRPGYGMEPKYFDMVLGREAKSDYKRGTALTWDKIS
jgi:N-acetylneuraminate synthase